MHASTKKQSAQRIAMFLAATVLISVLPVGDPSPAEAQDITVPAGGPSVNFEVHCYDGRGGGIYGIKGNVFGSARQYVYYRVLRHDLVTDQWHWEGSGSQGQTGNAQPYGNLSSTRPVYSFVNAYHSGDARIEVYLYVWWWSGTQWVGPYWAAPEWGKYYQYDNRQFIGRQGSSCQT